MSELIDIVAKISKIIEKAILEVPEAAQPVVRAELESLKGKTKEEVQAWLESKMYGYIEGSVLEHKLKVELMSEEEVLADIQAGTARIERQNQASVTSRENSIVIAKGICKGGLAILAAL